MCILAPDRTREGQRRGEGIAGIAKPGSRGILLRHHEREFFLPPFLKRGVRGDLEDNHPKIPLNPHFPKGDGERNVHSFRTPHHPPEHPKKVEKPDVSEWICLN
jgi:hypothetical protein